MRSKTASIILALLLTMCGGLAAGAINPAAPASPVKLIFIHHSSGENWLTDGNGNLGIALMGNNYFVSDTNYGWGPDTIGDSTDIGHWWSWFRGPRRDVYMTALFAESEQSGEFYSRLATDPGGANRIVMLKSCFPNSYLGGAPDDPPTAGANPLRGQSSGSEYMTVANAKGIYNDILVYFASRQDTLFVVVTAPPQAASETDATHAANARALNDWLVEDWLRDYPYHNVAVFDFYNVLTSNGGSPLSSDTGRETGNHHRWWLDALQHLQTVAYDMSAYPSSLWDSHPNAVGNRKASAEFSHVLNIYYHCWQGDGDCPGSADTCQDSDGDGYGTPASSLCTHPERDCDDSDAAVYPGAPEICDGADNQCPADSGYGRIDEGCDFALLSPPDRSTVTSPPVLTWTAAGYDLFRPLLLVRSRGRYHPLPLAPTAQSSLDLGSAPWWPLVDNGSWAAWYVLGISTTGPGQELAGPWLFQKTTP